MKSGLVFLFLLVPFTAFAQSTDTIATGVPMGAGQFLSAQSINRQGNVKIVGLGTTDQITVPLDVNLQPGKTVGLQESTSASKCMGSVTANGTTAVVTSTTCATTGSRIFLTPTSDPTGSTAAYCWVSAISDGVSFSIDCDQANDGTLNWIIFHESPAE